MHRTILVAATPDEAGRDALALAIELARPVGAEVVLAAVAGTGHAAELNDVTAALVAVRDAAPHDVPVRIEAIASVSLMRGLQDLAAEHDAQLLVLGPSHRSALERAVHGEVAAEAVFNAPCAIAVAVDGQAARVARRIGVAWDASPESDEALEWAVQLAERTGATLHIIRVLDPRHPEGTEPAPRAAERLERLRTEADFRAEAEATVLWGDAVPALLQASHSVDVLVVGSRARGPLRRAALGSVSTQLLRHAACPVVVLPRGVHAPADTAAV